MDEQEELIGQELETQEPIAAPEGGVTADERAELEKLRNDQKAWDGRVEKERERIRAANEQLSQYGYEIGEQGLSQRNDYVNPATYQQPVTQPVEEEEVEEWEKQVLTKAQKHVQEYIAPVVTGAGRVQDYLIGKELARENEDWSEIAPNVSENLRRLGAPSISQCIAAGRPDLIQLAINAARGERAAKSDAAAGGNDAEAARQAAVNAAASAGSATAASGGGGDYEFSPEEREELRRSGLSEADAAAMLEGPAKLKKRSK